ncbi:uncharacterized protein [Primulina huaijiensis]|uniref:uncharacterized protein n=1 Tax=Primulina huaijiensis TaxID=1492673 RepID=UPI003CC74C40
METSLGSNPSFIWRSIWSSQAILARGLRWKVVDGQHIKIWTHPWLRDSRNFYIQTPHIHQEEVKYVKELLITDTRQWNTGKLHEIFAPQDIQEIMNIPLNPLASNDDSIWHFSGDGRYTLKSGYRIIMETITNHEQATLWSIWRFRNEKLWSGVSRPPQTTVSLGYDMLWNLTQAQKNSTKGQAPSSRRDADDRWTKPPDPYVKCNVDATLFNEHQAVGFGFVVRDSAGEFMVSKTSVNYGLFEVKEAEALALLDAIAWTTSLELHDIIFETDSKTVVNAISSKNVDHTEFGSIISSCRKFLDAHPSFKIQHVRRQANMVAHALARAAISYANAFIMIHPPNILCNFISHDCEDNI